MFKNCLRSIQISRDTSALECAQPFAFIQLNTEVNHFHLQARLISSFQVENGIACN